MIYCVSDIHGCYEQLEQMLDKIGFSGEDLLYILGDVVDRGESPVKCLSFAMNTKNVKMLMGNHEYMMLNALRHDMGFDNWYGRNGGSVTLEQLNALEKGEAEKLLSFSAALPYFYELELNGRRFLLVHAGIRPELPLAEQSERDMVWLRDEFYREKALDGTTIIFGHTPVNHITEDGGSKQIWHDGRYGDKICIDCGCVYGGKLAALRLDDMAEFYIDGPEGN